MRSVFVEHDGVRLHVLDSGPGDGGAGRGRAPVLVVPGLGEQAVEYAWLAEALEGRRVVVADLRGRGRSDAPAAGYTWEHHCADLLAVVDARRLARPVAIAFSRGSAYALGAALRARRPFRGVVVNDYQACQRGLGPDDLEPLARMPIRGRPLAERMPPHVLRALVEESEDIPLWDRLRELDHPLLVVRGGRSPVVGAGAVARYRAARPDVELVTLPERGHDVWSRDPDAYLGVLRPFLHRADAQQPHRPPGPAAPGGAADPV